MNKHSFLIIHGLGGSGPDHWQSWLFHKLKQYNFHVCFPKFSNDNNPNKQVWLQELSAAFQSLPKNQQKTVITHSLGCLLWLHYIAVQTNQIADHVILVAPPSPKVVLPEARSFYPVPLDRENLLRAEADTLFIHSTNDPYCGIEDSIYYLKLDIPTILLSNMGHINTKSGHDKWQWILDQCLRITSSQ
jgi:uncharacterized protein